MKILVTCFDAFGKEKVNSASLVVRSLPDKINDADIIKLEIPTIFYTSIEIAKKAIDKFKPDFVLSIGQAGGRNRISVERIAINVDDATIADNENQIPVDIPIVEGGKEAYFSTIPIKDIVINIIANNIPCEISNTAGTFVCNHLMYGVLQYIDKKALGIKAGFIHIPFALEQVVDKPNMPSMSLAILKDGLIIAIKTLIQDYKEKLYKKIASS